MASFIDSQTLTPKKQKIRGVIRNGKEQEWIDSGAVPERGEVVYATDKNTIKVGDGISSFSSLPSISGGGDIDSEKVINKAEELPVASEENLGQVYMYSGESGDTYTHGYIYESKKQTTYSTIVTFDSEKISCFPSDFLNFLRDITPSFADVKFGTMQFIESANLWVFDGKNANGENIAHYQAYTEDFEEYGFTFTGTFEDEEVIGFECSVEVSEDYIWERLNVQPEGQGGSSSYTDLTNKPSINGVTLAGNKVSADLGIATAAQGALADSALQSGDNISELTNDSGYITGITGDDISTALGYYPADPDDLSNVAFSGSYNDLLNKPTIPSLPKYLSVERLGDYLFKATFDSIPEYVELPNLPLSGACSSYVKDGKLYRNFDWKYDNTATFEVVCRDFQGIGSIIGLNDGSLVADQIEQLPYHLVDGVNKHGIMVSTHILYNDWEYAGAGNKDKDIMLLPYYILSNLTSMVDINTVLGNYVANIKIPAALSTAEYLLHFVVTDGETTYCIMPPANATGSYVIQNITSNPKLTNFRWVSDATVVRGDLQTRPTGVERWNEIETVSGLDDLRFTKCYETPTRLSEFIGIDGTTKESTDAELTSIYNTAHSEYLIRQRDGKLWQTVHSVVLGPNGIEHLWNQENWDKDYVISGGGSGTEDFDSLINRPSYNSVPMTHATNIPEVKTATWDAKQDAISDLSTIRSNASSGKSASDTIATYGDIVTHDIDEFATAAQGSKADSAIQPSDNISELTNDAGYITSSYHDNTKQDVISDLSTIRSGAALGATAVQPGSLATVATSGDYEDLSNKPTIPVVPTNVSDFTNDADYQTGTQVSSAISTHNSDTSAHSDIRTEVAGKITSPSGGTTGQVLTKTASGTEWADVQSGGSYTAGTGIDITNNVISNTGLVQTEYGTDSMVVVPGGNWTSGYKFRTVVFGKDIVRASNPSNITLFGNTIYGSSSASGVGGGTTAFGSRISSSVTDGIIFGKNIKNSGTANIIIGSSDFDRSITDTQSFVVATYNADYKLLDLTNGTIPEARLADTSGAEAGQVLKLDENLNAVWATGGGSGGTSDYTELSNKPSINSVTLYGNKTSADLGLQSVSNLVTSVSSSSTDSQYPSAKLFYDTCGNIEALINAL